MTVTVFQLLDGEEDLEELGDLVEVQVVLVHQLLHVAGVDFLLVELEDVLVVEVRDQRVGDLEDAD